MEIWPRPGNVGRHWNGVSYVLPLGLLMSQELCSIDCRWGKSPRLSVGRAKISLPASQEGSRQGGAAPVWAETLEVEEMLQSSPRDSQSHKEAEPEDFGVVLVEGLGLFVSQAGDQRVWQRDWLMFVKDSSFQGLNPSEITRKLTEMPSGGPCDIHFTSEPSEIHRIQASPARLKSGEHQPHVSGSGGLCNLWL